MIYFEERKTTAPIIIPWLQCQRERASTDSSATACTVQGGVL